MISPALALASFSISEPSAPSDARPFN